MESAHLFVHWEEFDKERSTYHMEPDMKAFLDDEQQVADIRYIMKNNLAFALGSRLANLRAAPEATRIRQAVLPFCPADLVVPYFVEETAPSIYLYPR
jgi:hypothetical protein